MVKFTSTYMLFTEAYSNILIFTKFVYTLYCKTWHIPITTDLFIKYYWSPFQLAWLKMEQKMKVGRDGWESNYNKRHKNPNNYHWQMMLTTIPRSLKRCPCTCCHCFLTNCVNFHEDNYDFIDSVVRCALRDDIQFKQENYPEKICQKYHVLLKSECPKMPPQAVAAPLKGSCVCIYCCETVCRDATVDYQEYLYNTSLAVQCTMCKVKLAMQENFIGKICKMCHNKLMRHKIVVCVHCQSSNELWSSLIFNCLRYNIANPVPSYETDGHGQLYTCRKCHDMFITHVTCTKCQKSIPKKNYNFQTREICFMWKCNQRQHSLIQVNNVLQMGLNTSVKCVMLQWTLYVLFAPKNPKKCLSMFLRMKLWWYLPCSVICCQKDWRNAIYTSQ